MNSILDKLKEKTLKETKKTKGQINLILLNKIEKEIKELEKKEKEIKEINETITEVKEIKNNLGDFEEKTVLYIYSEDEEIKGVFLIKQEKKEMNMDTMYTFGNYRKKGIGMRLAKIAYERRETKKVYAYPIAETSKKIMRRLGFYELDDKEDYVWVNKINY